MKISHKKGRTRKQAHELNHLKAYLENKGKADLRTITLELYNDDSLELRSKARSRVHALRRILKKDGIFLYCVKKQFQYLDENTHVETIDVNRCKWDGYTKMLKDLIFVGAQKYPHLRAQLVHTLGEMQFTLWEESLKKPTNLLK